MAGVCRAPPWGPPHRAERGGKGSILQRPNTPSSHPTKVLLQTTFGDVDIELWPKEAPLACRNFVQLCMEGYFDDVIFHRIIKGWQLPGAERWPV